MLANTLYTRFCTIKYDLQQKLVFVIREAVACHQSRWTTLSRMKFGEQAFSHAGPATWNALPDHIRTVADLVKFRKLLKSHYFSQAFNI